MRVGYQMHFKEWEPYYQIILNKFGFSKTEDEKTAALLSHLIEKTIQNEDEKAIQNIKNGLFSFDYIKQTFFQKNIIICGNAPSLEFEFLQLKERFKDKAASADLFKDSVFVAADGAASVLIRFGRYPEVIVSDLDGKYDDDALKEIEATEFGSVLFVHAHGDNSDKIQKYWPLLENKILCGHVVPTCQCRPPKHLFNFGGFTDGDRCVFLANAFGAKQIILIGFDFNDSEVSPQKKMKLECAEKLIQILRQKSEKRILYFSEMEF